MKKTAATLIAICIAALASYSQSDQIAKERVQRLENGDVVVKLDPREARKIPETDLQPAVKKFIAHNLGIVELKEAFRKAIATTRDPRMRSPWDKDLAKNMSRHLDAKCKYSQKFNAEDVRRNIDCGMTVLVRFMACGEDDYKERMKISENRPEKAADLAKHLATYNKLTYDSKSNYAEFHIITGYNRQTGEFLLENNLRQEKGWFTSKEAKTYVKDVWTIAP